MSQTTHSRLSLPRLTEDLETLSRMGPRFMGSAANRGSVEYLVERFSEHAAIQVEKQDFSYLGWTPAAMPTLRIVAPEPAEVDCIAYIYCGPAPPGGISGELHELGEHWVIGDYKWDKFAIIDGEKIVGYISGRRDGVAIQQPLAETSRVVPHFGVGTETADRFRGWLAAGERIVVQGTIDTKVDADARADNVAARLAGTGDGARFLVCSHLDSMQVCPGANDNASGMAATLALADYFAASPLGHGVDFVIFNGEEWDLAGSKAYVARARQRGGLDGLDLVVNLDGIAYSDEHLQVWAGPEGLEDDLREVLRGGAWKDGPPLTLVSPPPMGADHVPS